MKGFASGIALGRHRNSNVDMGQNWGPQAHTFDLKQTVHVGGPKETPVSEDKLSKETHFKFPLVKFGCEVPYFGDVVSTSGGYLHISAACQGYPHFNSQHRWVSLPRSTMVFIGSQVGKAITMKLSKHPHGPPCYKYCNGCSFNPHVTWLRSPFFVGSPRNEEGAQKIGGFIFHGKNDDKPLSFETTPFCWVHSPGKLRLPTADALQLIWRPVALPGSFKLQPCPMAPAEFGLVENHILSYHRRDRTWHLRSWHLCAMFINSQNLFVFQAPEPLE